nr:relaxase/mobilization nuclease domain-containing protein [Prochloraceae cyanobacterium]
MIGKIVKGTYFRGVLDYLANKKQSKLIGGNMFGCDPKSLANEFALSRELNPRIKKIVNHVSLSLPIDETVNEKNWNKIAAEYIEKMGFKGSQYVIYRHGDRDHDHVHIVASRVRISDSSVVSDSWDYQRSQQIVRNLEQRYQLTPTQSSWEKDRSSITREELEYLKKTGQSSIRVQLQETIDRLAPIAQTMPRLLAAIAQSGIAYQIHSHKDGSIKGISYKLGEVNFPGYKLGKAYSFFGLQKYRNINYTYDKNAQISQVEALRLNSQSALNKLVKEESIVNRAVIGVSTPSKQQFELERAYT